MSVAAGLHEILILLAAAVVTVPLFHRFGLSSVLGYMAAGAVIGPWGLGLIAAVEEIRHIAELGVVFLLFLIGLEISPTRLWLLRRDLLLVGGGQVAVTGLVLTGVALLLDLPTGAAILAGFGLALSSTAMGLQLLAERRELGSQSGRTALAVLLLQDLAVVPLLALVPMLADTGATVAGGIGWAVAEAILVLVGVVLCGRLLLRPALRLIAGVRSPELFAAVAVLIALGTAFLTETVGLSLGLGAFLGGMLLADSEFRHQIEADIQPFRGFLLGLFFMAIGMSLHLDLVLRAWPELLGLLTGLLAIKATILWTVARLAGHDRAVALRLTGLLCAGGEFSLVLGTVATQAGVLEADTGQMVILTAVFGMILTPFLTGAAFRFAGRLSPPSGQAPPPGPQISGATRDHVLIAGYGRVGRAVGRILAEEQIPWMALDADPQRVTERRRDGDPVYFGDVARPEVLRAAGVDKARLVVVALDHPAAAVAAVRLIRAQFPDILVHARARDNDHARRLREAGAHQIIHEAEEAAGRMAGSVLDVVDMGRD